MQLPTQQDVAVSDRFWRSSSQSIKHTPQPHNRSLAASVRDVQGCFCKKNAFLDHAKRWQKVLDCCSIKGYQRCELQLLPSETIKMTEQHAVGAIEKLPLALPETSAAASVFREPKKAPLGRQAHESSFVIASNGSGNLLVHPIPRESNHPKRWPKKTRIHRASWYYWIISPQRQFLYHQKHIYQSSIFISFISLSWLQNKTITHSLHKKKLGFSVTSLLWGALNWLGEMGSPLCGPRSGLAKPDSLVARSFCRWYLRHNRSLGQSKQPASFCSCDWYDDKLYCTVNIHIVHLSGCNTFYSLSMETKMETIHIQFRIHSTLIMFYGKKYVETIHISPFGATTETKLPNSSAALQVIQGHPGKGGRSTGNATAHHGHHISWPFSVWSTSKYPCDTKKKKLPGRRNHSFSDWFSCFCFFWFEHVKQSELDNLCLNIQFVSRMVERLTDITRKKSGTKINPIPNSRNGIFTPCITGSFSMLVRLSGNFYLRPHLMGNRGTLLRHPLWGIDEGGIHRATHHGAWGRRRAGWPGAPGDRLPLAHGNLGSTASEGQHVLFWSTLAIFWAKESFFFGWFANSLLLYTSG